MDNKIKIGIIGTGFARHTQIPAFAACAGAEVVSVASRSMANAEQTAREFEIGHFTDNWKETVERDDIDLISITPPPALHHEMALYALAHDKHVLCEKPMAMNAGQAEEMTARAAEKNLLALIDHELRFLNGRRRAYEMIRAGRIGKVIHFKQMFRNASRGSQKVKWNWWSDAESGGGALGAIGSHLIDSFQWFLGTGISEVFCDLKTNIKERTAADGQRREVTSDDEANMIVRFAESELTEDASGTVAISMVEAGKYDMNCQIFGTAGSLIVGESGQLRFAKMGERDWTELEVDLGDPPPDCKPSGWSRGFMSFAEVIVSALQEGRTEIAHAATFADGLQIQKVLDAARRSDAERRVIGLPDVS